MILVAALACVALQVEAVSADGPSTLSSVELPSGVATTMTVLDQRLNAFGYSAAQGVYYGISPAGEVVVVDRQGGSSVVGHVPHSGLVQAVAGAIHGDYFYVRAAGAVYVMNINPASADFLGLVQAKMLWPLDVFVSVDDFDYNPADGLLYGVATKLLGHPEVVTVDPNTGYVNPLATPIPMPDGPGYGAAVLGPDGALYATNNDEGGQSTLYRVALDGSGSVTRLSARPAARTIDMAGCYAALPPTYVPPTTTTTTLPPVVTTTPPTTPTPLPPAETPVTTSEAVVPPPPSPTTTPPSVAPAAAPVPPPLVTTATTPTAPRVAPKPTYEVNRPVEEVVAVADRRTETKRRWSLAVLLLVIGAGAVAAQRARRA
ncbi:DUF6923 family protein [Umezawaea sp. NPDC059074]|uniref:DUF6923 family protein n=1 Tax=Umezawaea sp. NPDC059074 TaxID=3346716 RepID=UPI00368B397A